MADPLPLTSTQPGPGAAIAPWQDRVIAPSQWRVIDFISDLHLHAGDPATFRAWRGYLAHTGADAVFMLGDLFEVWVGDDMLGSGNHDARGEVDDFALACAEVLRQSATRRPQYFMCGNRDFLVGEKMLRACGLQGLADPCVLEFAGTRWLLSHGDALCLEDTEYQVFRRMVRARQWQSDFLAQPLAQRQAIARQLRAQSEQHKQAHPAPSVVDTDLASLWLHQAGAPTLIHGHTHQPADHALADGRQRWVLSDWDLHADLPRAQVLRLCLDAAGSSATAHRLTPEQAG
jgi:UDP-2,3-diacylglucosamine hydrolase